MNIYKGDVALNITNKGTVLFKTVTNMSEPIQISKLKGFHIDYCSNREVLYIYPMTSKGMHWLRWLSVEKEDIKSLIKTLEKFL